MLQIKNVNKQYKTGELVQQALDDITLNLRENEFVAVLGPSGSGKTTLLNIIGGLDRYDSGDLIIDNISTKEYSDRDWDAYRNHWVGFVFQSYNLIPHQSILANVELALTISGIGRSERRRRAEEALDAVGLADQKHKKPNQMSGGQMQRVAIARALVNDPSILLADEPTGALDSETGLAVMELLKEVAEDRLVVMVTHNQKLAERYATRIVRLKDGRIISDSDPYEGETTQESELEHKSMGKASMSIWTSLSLSFNNLLTKKGRTFLTAFAGSIGIIGIALIIALSTGVNEYIRETQKETMSSYPIMIEKHSFDLEKMVKEGEVQSKEQEPDHPKDGIYADGRELELSANIYANVAKNNLTSFKHYLDDPDSPIHDVIGEHGIIYTYDPAFSIYTEEPGGEFINTDGSRFREALKRSYAAMYQQPGEMPEMPEGEIPEGQIPEGEIPEGQVPSEGTDLPEGEIPEGQIPEGEIPEGQVPSEGTDLPEGEIPEGQIPEGEIPEGQIPQGQEIPGQTVPGQEIPGGQMPEVSDFLEGVGNRHFTEIMPSSSGEMISPILKENYEVIYGRGPESKEELVLILNSDNELRASALYELGFLPAEDYAELLKSVTAGEEIEVTDERIDYEKITEQTFWLYPECDEYVEEDDGGFRPADRSEEAHEERKDDALELKIVGVIRPKEEADYKPLHAALGYTRALTDYIMEYTADSPVVKAQEEDEEINILSGRAFDDEEGTSYEKNLQNFGLTDRDAPAGIQLYADSFENKDKISECIEDYNSTAAEEDQIVYTDYVGLLMSSVTSMLNVVTYVLIAFVAVSLVVSSIMIGIITYISVLERTKEIGILRAIGASKANIAQVFNAETFIIGLISGLLGIGLSCLILIPGNEWIRDLTGTAEIHAHLPVEAGLILLLLSVILTLLGGLIPSRIAAKKDPVIALRSE